jgi:hypothetical protein
MQNGARPAPRVSRRARAPARRSRSGGAFAAPRRRRPRSVVDLTEHEGVVYGHAGWVPPWRFLDAERRVQEVQSETRIVFDDMGAIVDATVAGAGLALEAVQVGVIEASKVFNRILGSKLDS